MNRIKPNASHDWKELGGGKKASVVEDAEVAGYDFVFQHGPSRNIDPIAVVRDDDDGSLQ